MVAARHHIVSLPVQAKCLLNPCTFMLKAHAFQRFATCQCHCHDPADTPKLLKAEHMEKMTCNANVLKSEAASLLKYNAMQDHTNADDRMPVMPAFMQSLPMHHQLKACSNNFLDVQPYGRVYASPRGQHVQ